MTTQHATCSPSASETPIGAAVRALLYQDDTGRGPAARCADRPREIALSQFEGDLRDWGFVYGMCFALARNESAWEPAESVAERALKIAWPIYLEWSGEITEPVSFAEAIDDLTRAYEGALPILRDELARREHEVICARLSSAIESVMIEAGHKREA